jgi:hypothetical protein
MNFPYWLPKAAGFYYKQKPQDLGNGCRFFVQYPRYFSSYRYGQAIMMYSKDSGLSGVYPDEGQGYSFGGSEVGARNDNK